MLRALSLVEGVGGVPQPLMYAESLTVLLIGA